MESNIITIQLSTSNEDFSSPQINNEKSDDILCSLNPQNNQITCQHTADIKSMHLIDLSGKKIELKSYQQSNDLINIDLQNIHPGVFILQLNTTKGWKKAKLVLME